MNMIAENYYDILGIHPKAEDEEVKQAFRELAKHYHPDRNPGDQEAERRFKLVNTAYDALKDEARRKSYDEWLVFHAAQKKAKQRQWGRLAAIVILLLLGPSAVLYGVVMSGAASIFNPSEERADLALTGQTQSDTAKIETGSATKPDKQASGEETGAGKSAEVKTPGNADRDNKGPATGLGGTGVAANTGQPDDHETRTAGLSPESAAFHALQEKPAAASEDSSLAEKSENVNDKGSDLSSTDYTNAIPTAVELPSAYARNAVPSASSGLTDGKLIGDKTIDSGGTVGSASALARLKEPGAGSAVGEALSSTRPQRRMAAQTPGPRISDTFSDCDLCPLMSVAKRPASVSDQGNLAVSLSDISVAQWNLCVNDGACSPYHAASNELSAPVIGLSLSDANTYAGWLSGITGESYRIVMPLGASRAGESVAKTEDNCDDIFARRQLSGWDWLEDRPVIKCERPASNRNAEDNARGFRVARQVRNDG